MTIYLLNSDARQIPLVDQSVQCVVTSPPYWGLRDYGVTGQIGLERTPKEYVASIVAVMREVWRVLRDDGVLWLNLGDSYHQGNKGNSGQIRPGDKQGTNRGSLDTRRGASLGPNRTTKLDGIKPKDLVGIPWRVAFALQDDGWYLRSDVIWSKPNVMPESVLDRPTKAHEYVFLLAKQSRYFYDAQAIAEPTECDRMRGPALHPDSISTNGNGGLSRRPISETRNKRSVWEVTTAPFSGAHFATFPPALVEPMILAGSRPGDVVLDPFSGSGTVGRVSAKHGRRFVGLELNPAYIALAQQRTSKVQIAMQFSDSVQQSFAADH